MSLPALGQAQNEGGNANGGTADKQQPTQQLPIPLPIQIIEDDEAASARKTSENEAAQREKDDLIAQQGMHTATQAMNEATQSMRLASWVSAGLVLLGTGLLVWTLKLTRSANKAAQEAVSVTREIGEKQTRAYIAIDDAAVVHVKDGSRPSITVRFINSGQTPAKRFRIVSTGGIITANPDDTKGPIPDASDQGGTTFGPGTTICHVRPIDYRMTPRVLDAISQKKAHFVIQGIAEYQIMTSARKKTRRYIFRLVSSNEMFDTKGGIIPLGPNKKGDYSD